MLESFFLCCFPTPAGIETPPLFGFGDTTIGKNEEHVKGTKGGDGYISNTSKKKMTRGKEEEKHIS